MQSLSI